VLFPFRGRAETFPLSGIRAVVEAMKGNRVSSRDSRMIRSSFNNSTALQ
jgi:hypothetical protein